MGLVEAWVKVTVMEGTMTVTSSSLPSRSLPDSFPRELRGPGGDLHVWSPAPLPHSGVQGWRGCAVGARVPVGSTLP